MGNFQKLRVWQHAKELAVRIYKISKTAPLLTVAPTYRRTVIPSYRNLTIF